MNKPTLHSVNINNQNRELANKNENGGNEIKYNSGSEIQIEVKGTKCNQRNLVKVHLLL